MGRGWRLMRPSPAAPPTGSLERLDIVGWCDGQQNLVLLQGIIIGGSIFEVVVSQPHTITPS
jgi:hypothetical protein